MTKPLPGPPLSADDRDRFKRCLQHWLHAFGLNDWRVVLSRQHTSQCADVECFYADRLARVRLGRDWGSLEVNSQTIDEVACHEAMHILMHEFHHAYRRRRERAVAIESAEHRVINALVRALIPGAREYQ